MWRICETVQSHLLKLNALVGKQEAAIDTLFGVLTFFVILW